MRLTPLAFLLLLSACAGGDDADKTNDTSGGDADTDTDADTDADSDTDTDTDTDSGTPSLQDVRQVMVQDASGCQDVDGTPVPGAARYFWGEYFGDVASGWTGQEAVYVFANDAWIAAGGADCEAHWTVTGGFGSTGDCPTCDVGVAVTATLDAVNTTCPVEMWGGDFETGYAVDLGTDSVATWYYTADATQFGTGIWNADVGMNFISERGCSWF